MALLKTALIFLAYGSVVVLLGGVLFNTFLEGQSDLVIGLGLTLYMIIGVVGYSGLLKLIDIWRNR